MKGSSDFAAEEFLRVRALWRGKRFARSGRRGSGGDDSSERSRPFGSGRDPRPIGDLLDLNAKTMGWSTELTRAELIGGWSELVGDRVSAHTEVIEIRNDLLVVQCDSTAWATELRRLRSEILTRLGERFPDAGITDLKFLAPGAPSWRHGPRVVPGRGPRDTYG